MTTSDVPVPGGTQRVPTYAFTEDAKTKDLERVALNESDGSDLALGAKLGALTETAPTTDTASSGLNGRLQRIAQRLTTLIGNLAFVFGSGTAAAAQRVTLASDDPGVTGIGSLTETASTTDTASSGLNGRLQRIAQRLTTLIGNLPFVFGSGTAAAAQRVTLASDDPGVTGIGSLTETAPTTDTASSGLNGRLQRIAQRLSTLITNLAFVFGAGTAAAAQRVTLASDDPAVGTLGATSGAKVITDANGTLQQYLRGLVSQWISSTLTLASRAASAAVTLTRTADTNAYAANDVIGAATGSTAALTFSNLGPSGADATITSVSLEIDASAVIGGETSYRLHLYNVTPPSALGDNAAWDLPSGDRASYLGYVDLGTPVDLGSTLYVQSDNINKQVKLSGTNLFGYLVTIGAYTPTSARVHVITLHTVS
jgi:tetrahydromethanopterin S-methyltransferase subunit D